MADLRMKIDLTANLQTVEAASEVCRKVRHAIASLGIPEHNVHIEASVTETYEFDNLSL